MVLAFDHFKAYLLNTQKSVIVFTDARALMWVGRNREYSIACNGLVNKLAKIQLEIPHVVYSVPSEVNYLADIFSLLGLVIFTTLAVIVGYVFFTRYYLTLKQRFLLNKGRYDLPVYTC